MNDTKYLDAILGQPLSLECQKAFIQKLCGCNFLGKHACPGSNTPADSYFRYQEEQCRLAIYDDQRIGLTATYRDIVQVIQAIQDENLDRDALNLRLQTKSEIEKSDTDSAKTAYDDSDECADNLINLSISLWLMIPIGRFRQISQPGTSLDWQMGSLQDTLALQFKQTAPTKSPITLGKSFNARNIQTIGGIRIIWTDNLGDHLRVHDEPTRVSIFHHFTFLQYHQQTQTRVFPPGFIEETLKTLALLLPCHDQKVKSWYQKEARRFKLDENAVRGKPLKTEDRQLETFEYWNERIEILKDIFDDAEPNTVLQWWQDRRRKVQWYTFWVAVLVLVLTVFFGIIQSIEGGMQVYKAYHPS